MRIIATQFGILFALLVFSGKLLSGGSLGLAAVSGVATGAAIFLALLATDAAIDRYLRHRYAVPRELIEDSATRSDEDKPSSNPHTGNRAA